MTVSGPGQTAVLSADVLVVDDDPDVRLMIRWALEEEGLTVATAGDGRAALDLLAARRPALLVLDMSLPLVDGYGVAAGLRAAYGADVPILLVTADGRAAEKARRLGARAYLHKPFEVDELVRAVQRIIQAA
ncbi:MAG TPA: response regulator [Dehalococcoidia bacterium]|jgi:CheY-like chemotaxis protein